MSKSSTPLQHKAYPSASAFDVASAAPDTGPASAFGDTVLLPRAEAESHQGIGQDGPPPAAAGSLARGQEDPFGTPAQSSPFGASLVQDVPAPAPSVAEAAASPFGAAPAAQPGLEPEPLVSQLPVIDRPRPARGEPGPSASEETGLQQAAYPSAGGPSTVTLPSAPRQGGKRPSRVRSSLKSFVSSDQSLTQPMRGIARLAQRPFNIAATRADYVREKEAAREVLNFSLRLAETMFHYGADTVDVDSAIVAVCAAYGLDDVEIDITNQSVIINYVSGLDEVDDQTRAINLSGESSPGKERFSHTVMRVVRSWSENYAALDDIYKLINDITAGGLPRHRAERRLHKINTAKKPYSPMIIMLANIVAAFSLVLALGGSVSAGIVGGLVFLAIHFVNSLISRLKMPGFFTMAAGAGVVTFAAIYISDDSSIFSQVGFHVSAPHIVAAGLIMLLPTARLVSTVQDALNGFPLTAAGKFVSTGMSFLGIVVGLASAVAVLSVLAISELDITETRFVGAHPITAYLGFLVASLAFAVTSQARTKTLLWITVITTAGFWVHQGYSLAFGAGAGRANTAFAALIIGLMSTFLAYKLHSPASIFYVPALTFLLPGLSVFRGLYLFTVEANSAAGVPGMISAIAIILSMASGVVLGSYLMQYVIQHYLSPARPSPDVGPETRTIDTRNIEVRDR
ncbi:threonine/serine exporter family protein [Rothia nasimurium]|uniref:threonine/serine ThrE exporter family protein n=1 Tax=Rothia nasimurium TaxID=85336 RepID=UPI003BA06099